MQEDEPGQDFLPEDQRLRSLEERLRVAHREEAERTGKQRGPAKGYSQGQRVLAEMLGGPVGGAVIGFVLDRIFGTTPWLLLAMMFLGFGVAIRNVIKISNERPE